MPLLYPWGHLAVLVIVVCSFLTGYDWLLNVFLTWHLVYHFLPSMRLTGQFQFNSSKFCVQSVCYLQQWALTFKFWEATMGNGNSLYCFGSLLASLDQQLKGKFIMPGTGLFLFLISLMALGGNKTIPCGITFIQTTYMYLKLIHFLTAFSDILSVTSPSNLSIFPISFFIAPLTYHPPFLNSFLHKVSFYFPGFWGYFWLYTHISRFGARTHK